MASRTDAIQPLACENAPRDSALDVQRLHSEAAALLAKEADWCARKKPASRDGATNNAAVDLGSQPPSYRPESEIAPAASSNRPVRSTSRAASRISRTMGSRFVLRQNQLRSH